MVTTTEQITHLNEQANPESRILITPRDEDRFLLPCTEAVEACQTHLSRKLWFDELDAMFVYVKKWLGEHEEQVRAAYAAPRDGQVVIFVVPKSDSYDLNLGSQLTDLDIVLAEQYSRIASEVLQIPGKTPEELSTFVNPKESMAIYCVG